MNTTKLYISICIHSSIRTYIKCTLHTYSHSTLNTCTLHSYIQLHLYSIQTNNFKLCTPNNFIRLDALLTVKLYDLRYLDGSKLQYFTNVHTSDTTILSTYMNTNNYTLHTYMKQLHSNILYKCTYNYSYTYVHTYSYTFLYIHTYSYYQHAYIHTSSLHI